MQVGFIHTGLLQTECTMEGFAKVRAQQDAAKGGACAFVTLTLP